MCGIACHTETTWNNKWSNDIKLVMLGGLFGTKKPNTLSSGQELPSRHWQLCWHSSRRHSRWCPSLSRATPCATQIGAMLHPSFGLTALWKFRITKWYVAFTVSICFYYDLQYLFHWPSATPSAVAALAFEGPVQKHGTCGHGFPSHGDNGMFFNLNLYKNDFSIKSRWVQYF